jgi:transposase
LTRERTNFVQQRATLVNRVQKLLEDANIKLGSVISDVLGVSGRAMLNGLLEGTASPEALADLAQKRMRQNRAAIALALEGRMKPVHGQVLTELLCQIDSLEETLGRLSSEIARRTTPDAAVLARLDRVPGLGQTSLEGIVAEIGTDMAVWGSAARLAAWCGVAPGNNESAGKRRSGKARAGNKWVRTLLIQAAWGAVRTKGSYFGVQYRRLAARRGSKRAIVAVAHSLVVVIYHMLERGSEYAELGSEYFERRRPAATAQRLARQIEQLGYKVTLEGTPSGA